MSTTTTKERKSRRTKQSFKTQQVLRLAKERRSEPTPMLPEGIRVIVMSSPEEGKTKVKIQDPDHPELWDTRVVLPNRMFETTSRGRPPATNGDGDD